MPTTRYYPKVSKATMYAFTADLARFLINDLGGYTGPGWTIVEAYSSGAGVGTKYRVPTIGDEGNMDNASFAAGGDFGWQTGVIANTDWITLESAIGSYGTKCQVCFKMHNSTTLHIILFPLANFATGSGTTPPTYASPSVGAGSASPVDFRGYAGVGNYSIIADESMFALLSDDGGTPYWIYVGEVDTARDNGTPADDRPFVIWDYPPTTQIYNGDGYFNRVSPVDDSTVLTMGYPTLLYGGASFLHYTGGGDSNLLGVWSVHPVGVYFHDTSHKHLAGFLRNVGSVHSDAGSSGTLDTKNWMYRGTSASYGRVAFKWDGLTVY